MFDKKSTERVMELFFLNPKKTLHLRELSRRIDMSVSTVSMAVDKLEDEGLLKVEKDAVKEISANRNQLFKDLKLSYNLQRLAISGLTDKVERNLRPDAVVLFGSYSRGEDSSESDIDIAAVNGRDEEIDVSKFERKLERNINVHNVSLEEAGRNFIKTLANGIVLRGYLDI